MEGGGGGGGGFHEDGGRCSGPRGSGVANKKQNWRRRAKKDLYAQYFGPRLGRGFDNERVECCGIDRGHNNYKNIATSRLLLAISKCQMGFGISLSKI